jgi:hypothetical protein
VSDKAKTVAELIAELKAMFVENEQILKSFPAEERGEPEGALAAGKLASSMERAGLKVEFIEGLIEPLNDYLTTIRRAIAERQPDDKIRTLLEELATTVSEYRTEIAGNPQGRDSPTPGDDVSK